ncbi:MAG TPA: carbohydrate-binding module family 20 domain-containing protein [Rugosimonospora sp.]|nr:carbohydrate-binding module family 20 domain-containing protein [Rugosimonospora sp.]
MRRRTRTVLAVVALAAAALAYPLVRTAAPAGAAASTNDVIANLFMWPWTSVATECTGVLGPAGYGAVQVSPPEDSISVSGHPWWDVYQPAAYDLNSRMGTRAQFAAMVSTCHAAGVKVYADAVINHMTGVNQTSTTSYGGATFTNSYSYPSAGYTSTDFHYYPANCPESDNQIHNWDSQTEVQECQLLSLADLNTESDHVRSTIAGYLNDLMGLGVDGFRVDAAKHINPTDMAAIKAKLTTQPSYFAQEVYPGSSNTALQMPAFEGNGGVLEFTYAYDLKSQFTGSIANLQTFGTSWGLQPSALATAFVSNHDTERAGSTLSYKNGTTDTLASVFMLAWNYGTPNVMSSFDFASSDQAPPSDANGFVTAPVCGSGWECQHRTRAIRNMVGFHNATHGDTTVSNWWSDGSNEIAFSRGPASAANGWVSLNNSGNTLTDQTFTTGLPAGTYCDIIHGDFTAATGTCSGPTIVVSSSGTATVSVAAKDAVAIDVNARVGTTTTASPSPTASSSTVSVTFTVSGAPGNVPVYLVGSVSQLGSWAPAGAVPMTQSGSTWSTTVALPPGTAIEYKFIGKDTSGNVTWEPGSNHTATTPASGATTLASTWNGSTSTVGVTFNATATTWYGQNVYVVGSVGALGNWNTASAVALSSANYPVWSVTVSLPVSTSFEYKYIKKDPDGTIEWESGANRSYTTGSSAATLTGTWQGTASTVATVTFSEYATTTYGQNVFVVGSITALGGWNTANAVALSSAAYPTWTGSVTLLSGQYFEYKYIKKNTDGSVAWESGTNRYYTVGTSAVTLSDTWK